jgi:predicted lysophospholipase L1 biosynthesis ABC-type transport system permease subunit
MMASFRERAPCGALVHAKVLNLACELAVIALAVVVTPLLRATHVLRAAVVHQHVGHNGDPEWAFLLAVGALHALQAIAVRKFHGLFL